MTLDIDRVTNLIREAAEAEILPRFRRLGAEDIQEKTGPKDLVTAADLAMEAVLERRLRDVLPGARIVGEETAAKSPAVLDHLGEDEPVWIIDPVDGTSNFVAGKRDFTVIVALADKGRVRAGWIHHVLENFTITAEEGSGTWCGSERQHVARPRRLEEMTAALYVSKARAPAIYERLKELKDRLGPRHYRSCAGLEYIDLARGRSHYAMFTRLLPWDHAAGSLIHAEAGGWGRLLDGEPYRPALLPGPILYAPDEPTWLMLREVLTGKR
jgi:fructose-1,6-bisphosphatase/inositol monophosphatase family enzyme